MPERWLIQAANAMQVCVPLMSLSAYVPQWKKIIAAQSSQNISLRTWLIWSVSSVFACCYALIQWQINTQGWPLLVSSTATLACVVTTVVLVLRYRSRQ